MGHASSEQQKGRRKGTIASPQAPGGVSACPAEQWKDLEPTGSGLAAPRVSARVEASVSALTQLVMGKDVVPSSGGTRGPRLITATDPSGHGTSQNVLTLSWCQAGFWERGIC